jgi:hypothetical protein
MAATTESDEATLPETERASAGSRRPFCGLSNVR